MYRTFLDRWGTTYLSAAIEGGALEITMSETKDRDGSNEEIKNTLAASYFGLGSMNPSVSNALKKSQEGRDGYLNLLIAGGSKEARAAVQNRFEKMLDAPTTGSTADPSQPQNMTAIWSTSVESGYSVITKGINKIIDVMIHLLMI